jgi:hypothetical protein
MKKKIISLSVLLMAALSSSVFANKPLTFEERVKAQEAIERVYYNHRIWPKENPQPKPPFEKMVAKEQIEAKVTDYLKKCSALDQFWQRPVIASQLQAEMDRMAKGTKDPQILNELFRALNDDPYLIAECLARPVLADRLINNWYANDERFHSEAREKAEQALKTLTVQNFCSYPDGQYSKMTYRLEVEGREEMDRPDLKNHAIGLSDKEFTKMYSEILNEGKISDIQEKIDSFLIIHTISKNEGEMEIECLSFAKKSADEWLKGQDIETELTYTELSKKKLYLPPITESACTEGWWDNGTLDDVPDQRAYHTAVWTGTEMIIWGGYPGINSGGMYNPSTDSWVPTTTGSNVPSARWSNTAVWTGSEMIVWGGNNGLQDGGRYNPLNDSWLPTSTGSNCPTGRSAHSAVWTGSEMIIWGGGYQDGSWYKLNTGARYNPSSDTWTTTALGTNCPSPRFDHSAVWTGTEMIIWGGPETNTGGRYNPTSDSWAPTSTGSGCPASGIGSAVWTGSKMIIWGSGKGGVYDPATDSWTATSTEANCPSARTGHTAVWTGTEMIVWGGGYWDSINDVNYSYNNGGRYNPLTDTWGSMTTVCASLGRFNHTAVWTGSEMIVWGGNYYIYPNNNGNSASIGTGGRYNPVSDSWVATNANIAKGAYKHSAIWTGSEMIIWGGIIDQKQLSQGRTNEGSKYYPSTDSWILTSTGTGCPSARCSHTAVWTGNEMITWGGYGPYSAGKGDGGRYNPVTDLWTPISTGSNCPSGRGQHTAVWTGAEMIVWGGNGSSPTYKNDGGKYNPNTDSWSTISTGLNCPSARQYHTSLWAENKMIVWGGYQSASPYYTNTGGIYNPITDRWTATSTGINCPSARSGHKAVWTGSEMIVWGGATNTGGRYNPTLDSWTPTSTGSGCPGQGIGSAVWTGIEMIISSGNTGGKYFPASDTWQSMPSTGAPSSRSGHTAVWTGNSMLIWGGTGEGPNSLMLSGGIYYIPYSPSGLTSNAGDSVGCSDDGVLIEWSSPFWGDSGSGTRTFDVLRDGAPVATGLSETTLSYTDTTGDNGVSYLYQVRANNSCGLSTMTAGVSAADNVGASPDEVSSFDNMYSWDSVPGADGYRLYRGTYADLPNLMNLNSDGCIRYDGAATSFDCSLEDPSLVTGKLYWYLVTAYTGVCEGTAGEGTRFTRNLSSSGACP